MSTGIIKKFWQVANVGGWAESFNFWIGNQGTADSLAGCTAQLVLQQPGLLPGSALTYNSGDNPSYLTVSGNSVAINIPRTITSAWPFGIYDILLRVISGATVDKYTLIGRGRLEVVEAPGT